MSSVIDFATALENAIQAGEAVEGNVVKIIADNGTEIGDVVYKVIEGGNGAAAEVGVGVQETTGGGLLATGMSFLALDIGVVGAALAPALGVAAGYGLYNIAPEFWDDLGESLYDAGCTIGGKVIGYWNGENIYFSESTIENFKNKLIASGYLARNMAANSEETFSMPSIKNHTFPYGAYSPGFKFYLIDTNNETKYFQLPSAFDVFPYYASCIDSNDTYPQHVDLRFLFFSPEPVQTPSGYTVHTFTYDNKTVYWISTDYIWSGERVSSKDKYLFVVDTYENMHAAMVNYPDQLAWTLCYGTQSGYGYTQPGAVLPSADEEFPLTYPEWTPYEYPIALPDPSELPTVYPVKYPGIGPDPLPEQQPAQEPAPEPVPEVYPVIMPDFAIPNPNPNPSPTPDPDPDPQPVPDPLPETVDPDVPSDPIDPNPDPPPSPIIPLPGLPDTVSSNKLFTVYNPTSSQLDALGGYLWDSSIMAALRDIWQDPLDGIISLIQVYVTPVTGSSHNIILGFLDSGVSSSVVTSQFATIDCGTITLEESKQNATDYTPYTSLHIYLPFIGIVELDTNECMNADITVTYKVDVYTGTCLATISVDRDADMPNNPILYTYSGNCSQQLPLTSGNSTGMLSALIGGITAGLGAAAGGGLGVVAGLQIAGNSLTHEMMHVQHSGNISSNAGIMGNKKPYLIIGRRHGYDANNYNSFYGFPANKTVYLGNHTGYVKVKKCWLQSKANNKEYNMILNALQEGVIL